MKVRYGLSDIDRVVSSEIKENQYIQICPLPSYEPQNDQSIIIYYKKIIGSFNTHSHSMKFFIDIITQIYHQLSQSITNCLNIRPKQHILDNPLGQIQTLKKDHPKDRKMVKRRKSFKSFMREEESYSRIRKYLQRKKRRKANDSRSRCRKGSRKQQMEDQSSQQDCAFADIYTKEVHDGIIKFQSQKEHCGAIFKDRNGFQISFIENISEKSEENSQNVSVDSDPELVKFVFKDQEMLLQLQKEKKPALMRFNFQSFIEKDSKAWWQKIIQSNKKLRAEQNRNQQLQSSNNSHKKPQISPFAKKSKVKRVQKGDGGQRSSKNERGHIRVIQLIDLIDSQDCPKIFQIPLSHQSI